MVVGFEAAESGKAALCPAAVRGRVMASFNNFHESIFFYLTTFLHCEFLLPSKEVFTLETSILGFCQNKKKSPHNV